MSRARFSFNLRMLFLLIVVLPGTAALGAGGKDRRASAERFHEETHWHIEPSLKYDALCLINMLTADPFYIWRYPQVAAHFGPKLTPEVRQALANLKRKIKDEGGGIISARLCLYFSATDDESLDDMLKTLKRPNKLRRQFAKTVYWSEEGWRQFEAIMDDLTVVLNWYKEIGFEDYWRHHVRPTAAQRAEEMHKRVRPFKIIPLIEKHLGTPLESDTITVYMLSYAQPHGIKITGTRFLTDVAWPFEIVMRNAVHEMMHPPYRLEGDDELRAVIDELGKDSFLMDKVENHNPSFGYNTLEGFVEEDCVQALEQMINEKLEIAEDAKTRWAQSDDGMHVLAVALYRLMTAENYPSADKSIRDFLVRMEKEGQLAPGRIEAHHRAMYAKAKPD